MAVLLSTSFSAGSPGTWAFKSTCSTPFPPPKRKKKKIKRGERREYSALLYNSRWDLFPPNQDLRIQAPHTAGSSPVPPLFPLSTSHSYSCCLQCSPTAWLGHHGLPRAVCKPTTPLLQVSWWVFDGWGDHQWPLELLHPHSWWNHDSWVPSTHSLANSTETC